MVTSYFFRIAGPAAYSCLLVIGTVRILLDLFPYQFHSLNHRIYSFILILFIVGIPGCEILFQFLTCDLACDSSINDIFSALYDFQLDFQICPSYVSPVTIITLMLTYGTILFQEFKRRNNNSVEPHRHVVRAHQQQQKIQNGIPLQTVYSVGHLIEGSGLSPQQVFKLATLANFF